MKSTIYREIRDKPYHQFVKVYSGKILPDMLSRIDENYYFREIRSILYLPEIVFFINS